MADISSQDVDSRLAQPAVDSTTAGANGVTLPNGTGVEVATANNSGDGSLNLQSSFSKTGDESAAPDIKDERAGSPTDPESTPGGKTAEKGSATKTAAPRKPVAVKSMSLNKAFLSGTQPTSVQPAPVSKLSLSMDKVSKGNGPGLVPASTAASKPRLVGKIGQTGARIGGIGQLGGKGGGMPSVWNRNMPATPAPAKEYSDEELSRHGIHMAERIQNEDSKESKWADIDDEDDGWVPPDTIEWNDGTKVTLEANEKPTISAFEKQIGTAASSEQRTAHSHPLGSLLPSNPNPTELSKRTEVATGAPPVKTAWAPVPSGAFPTPRPIPTPNQQYGGRPSFSGPRPTIFGSGGSPKEVAADDFNRPSWRNRGSHQSNTLFNSETGNFDPVSEANRNRDFARRNSRTEYTGGMRPTSLLQRGDAGPEPPMQFQRFPGRPEGEHHPYGSPPGGLDAGRRRSASIRSSAMSDASSNAHPPLGPNVVAASGGGVMDPLAGRPHQPNVYVHPVMPGPDRRMSGSGPQLIPPSDVETEEPSEPAEDIVEAQKRLMKESIEQARARKLADEAAEEELKKLRIQKKLAELDAKAAAKAEAAAAAAAAIAESQATTKGADDNAESKEVSATGALAPAAIVGPGAGNWRATASSNNSDNIGSGGGSMQAPPPPPLVNGLSSGAPGRYVPRRYQPPQAQAPPPPSNTADGSSVAGLSNVEIPTSQQQHNTSPYTSTPTSTSMATAPMQPLPQPPLTTTTTSPPMMTVGNQHKSTVTMPNTNTPYSASSASSNSSAAAQTFKKQNPYNINLPHHSLPPLPPSSNKSPIFSHASPATVMQPHHTHQANNTSTAYNMPRSPHAQFNRPTAPQPFNSHANITSTYPPTFPHRSTTLAEGPQPPHSDVASHSEERPSEIFNNIQEAESALPSELLATINAPDNIAVEMSHRQYRGPEPKAAQVPPHLRNNIKTHLHIGSEANITDPLWKSNPPATTNPHWANAGSRVPPPQNTGSDEHRVSKWSDRTTAGQNTLNNQQRNGHNNMQNGNYSRNGNNNQTGRNGQNASKRSILKFGDEASASTTGVSQWASFSQNAVQNTMIENAKEAERRREVAQARRDAGIPLVSEPPVPTILGYDSDDDHKLDRARKPLNVTAKKDASQTISTPIKPTTTKETTSPSHSHGRASLDAISKLQETIMCKINHGVDVPVNFGSASVKPAAPPAPDHGKHIYDPSLQVMSKPLYEESVMTRPKVSIPRVAIPRAAAIKTQILPKISLKPETPNTCPTEDEFNGMAFEQEFGSTPTVCFPALKYKADYRPLPYTTNDKQGFKAKRHQKFLGFRAEHVSSIPLTPYSIFDAPEDFGKIRVRLPGMTQASVYEMPERLKTTLAEAIAAETRNNFKQGRQGSNNKAGNKSTPPNTASTPTEVAQSHPAQPPAGTHGRRPGRRGGNGNFNGRRGGADFQPSR